MSFEIIPLVIGLILGIALGTANIKVMKIFVKKALSLERKKTILFLFLSYVLRYLVIGGIMVFSIKTSYINILTLSSGIVLMLFIFPKKEVSVNERSN